MVFSIKNNMAACFVISWETHHYCETRITAEEILYSSVFDSCLEMAVDCDLGNHIFMFVTCFFHWQSKIAGV